MNSAQTPPTVPLDSHRYFHPWMRPVPLEDPELAHLSEGQIAALITKCHREYDWHTQVSKRKYRQLMVDRLKLLATDQHPVIQEWGWLSRATNQEYARYMRNLRKVELWEAKFQEAKTTYGRHQALMNLWKVVPESHPIVQLYLNRHEHKPESRKGWWELEPASKKAKTAKRSTGSVKRGSTTRRGTTSTPRLAEANQDLSWL